MAQRQFRSDDTSKWVYGFGNGHDGSAAVSGTINSYASCTGTATETTLTTSLSATEGDIIVIHQSRGTGAGAVGRIHIDYKTSITGTSNPSLDSTQDTSLNDSNYGSFIPFL